MLSLFWTEWDRKNSSTSAQKDQKSNENSHDSAYAEGRREESTKRVAQPHDLTGPQ
jgi:hypothetical protein